MGVNRNFRKHEYRRKTLYREGTEQVESQFYQCVYCQGMTELDFNILHRLSPVAAECSGKGNGISRIERITSSYSCV